MDEAEVRQWLKRNADNLTPEIPLDTTELDHVAKCMHHIWQWYFEDRPLGDFLTAVVKDEFAEACIKADDANRKSLYLYALFLHHHIGYDYRDKASKKGGK